MRKFINPWPPEIIPEVYFSGFNHWYAGSNISRIENSLKDIVQSSGFNSSLDVNFGNPFMLSVLRQYFNTVHGHYISAGKIRSQFESGNISISEGDCYDIPFPDKCFNLVTSYAFLHLIPDHKLYFQEVYRLLKDDGCLYTDGDKNLLITKIIRFFKLIYFKVRRNDVEYNKWRLALKPKLNYHQEGIDISVIKRMLFESGFKRVIVKPWITMKPEYSEKQLVRLLICTMKFFRLNFLFTHVQIIAYK